MHFDYQIQLSTACTRRCRLQTQQEAHTSIRPIATGQRLLWPSAFPQPPPTYQGLPTEEIAFW